MQCAPVACVPCRQKKRKCDRLLPACSRCSSVRTNEPCWYKNRCRLICPVGPDVARQPTKAKMSCEQCRSQKRACNRVLPSCTRCQSLSKECVYGTIPAHKRIAKSSYQISTGDSNTKTNLRTIYGPEICIDYPVRDSKYIPGLLHHFCSVLVIPATAALPNSLARHVQSIWMRYAMHDPCLFHSTIFSASAHLDGLFGIAENPRTIYHQLQAVKLLRERLRQPHFRVNYETVGAVLGLGYFDILIGNADGVQAHNQGLIQMLTTKHDQGVETEALLGLANMTHFTLSMVSNTDALYLSRSTISCDKSSHPANPLAGISAASLLSRVLARAAARTDILAPQLFTPDTVLYLVGTAHVFAQQDANPPLRVSLAETTTAASATILTLGAEALRLTSFFPSLGDQSTTATNINTCVQLAAKICRNLLQRAARGGPSTSPPPPTTSRIRTRTMVTPIITTTTTAKPTSSTTKPNPLHDDISLLKATLPKIDFISWLQHAPEAYIWVCFTAAAATVAAADCRDEERSGESENDDWTSFILTPMPVITAMDSAELRLMREGWAYLRWLRWKCEA
ncbi:hypothetical protein PMG11_03172 [Penicillium brasilianum]|uniref:Zn(2)-C6 fungal-type domain-containing protein n=1 Tax=Penicillium brasilianum TaxID=104259 RepID=A0A0F7V962_PENBI|nr:hypothetical protein PMG11_03172 [Penicillium brasilianum]